MHIGNQNTSIELSNISFQRITFPIIKWMGGGGQQHGNMPNTRQPIPIYESPSKGWQTYLIRAGLQCFLSVAWVITQTEQNYHPITEMKKFLNSNVF